MEEPLGWEGESYSIEAGCDSNTTDLMGAQGFVGVVNSIEMQYIEHGNN